MNFVLQIAVLSLIAFGMIAVFVMVPRTLLSRATAAGHLQPKFSIKAQGCSLLFCMFFVPGFLFWIFPGMYQQDQINTIVVTISVLSVVWLMLLTLHLRRNQGSERP